MKKRLLIALTVLGVLVVVATVVVTGVIPMGTVILRLDQETYLPYETVTLTIRSLRTGSVQFGDRFEVQRFEDGDWVDVPLDVFFRIVDFVLLPGCRMSRALFRLSTSLRPPRPEDTGWLRNSGSGRRCMERSVQSTVQSTLLSPNST